VSINVQSIAMRLYRLALSGLFLLLLPVATPAIGQDAIAFSDSSRIWIDGTSNRSDWTVHAQIFEAHLFMDTRAEAPVPDSVALVVDAMALESRKSTIMDRLMQRTLNASNHPEIRFMSTSIERVDSLEAWTVTGDLAIAGETRSVTVPVLRSEEGGAMVWTGSSTILMTDFNMRPPTAMFGALHTADEVTVHFRLVEAASEE